VIKKIYRAINAMKEIDRLTAPVYCFSCYIGALIKAAQILFHF